MKWIIHFCLYCMTCCWNVMRIVIGWSKMRSSKVWEVFEKSADSEGRSMVKCRLRWVTRTSAHQSWECIHVCIFNANTLERVNELLPTALATTQASSEDGTTAPQGTVVQFFSKQVPPNKESPTYTTLTQSCLSMICPDLQPLSFVENVGFWYLMAKAEQRYTIPSRTTLSHKLIPELYRKNLGKVKSVIKERLLPPK